MGCPVTRSEKVSSRDLYFTAQKALSKVVWNKKETIDMPRDLYLCSEMKSHSYCVIKISFSLCASHYHKELFYFLKLKYYVNFYQVWASKTSNRMVYFFSLLIIFPSPLFVILYPWLFGIVANLYFRVDVKIKKCFSILLFIMCIPVSFLTVIYKQCSVSCSVPILSENV